LVDLQQRSVARDEKPWDRTRLFQRVGSPSHRPGEPALDGNGHQQGTRRFEDFDKGFGFGFEAKPLRAGIRMVPAWVRTLPRPGEPNFGTHGLLPEAEAEHELYGQLIRSFQTWTDVPAFQWHRWYDWNFHVLPAEEFDWLRGRGNREAPPPKAGHRPFCQMQGKKQKEGAIECEWDTGGFSTSRPGGMFTTLGKQQDGLSPLTSNWIWPMAGDWVWITGRSIYDGGHEHNRMCRTELHPCKAMAFARRAAAPLPGAAHAVPVTQFAFYSSAIGGLLNFHTLAPPKDGEDYEFLVDLPLMPDEYLPLEHPIGVAPDFPFNRIQLRRPEPVFTVDFDTFAHNTKKFVPDDVRREFPPEVTFETPDPAKPLEMQARIRVPFKAMCKKFPDARAYGFIVSLGFADPSATQKTKVKRCSVKLVSVKAVSAGFSIVEDIPIVGIFFKSEFRLKFCVNHRWFHFDAENVGSDDVLKLVHAHGLEADLMDDVIRDEPGNRTIMFNDIQVVAEAISSGEQVPPGIDPNLAEGVLALPLAAIEALARIPVLGAIPQWLNGILAIFGLSPGQLLGKVGSRPVKWLEHVDIRPPRTGGGFTNTHVIQRVVVRNILDKLAKTIAQENGPLGMIDPGGGVGDAPKFNPLAVKPADGTKPRVAADGKPVPFELMALSLEEDSDLAELYELDIPAGTPDAPFKDGGPKRGSVSYELKYEVTLEPQS
jgi:hypothetical protein